MPKAREAFRNIGEVAAELEVKKHVLRFWEQKFPQLRPMKRGGGRRLYRPSDVQLLRGIRDLLQSSGYTIKGVQKILREQGIDEVKQQAARGRLAKAADGRADAPATTPAPAPQVSPILLGVAQVQALRNVMAELNACHLLLAGGAQTRGERQPKRGAASPAE